MVFVITLIVVGPHRFPEIARQAGHYYRTARRYAAEVTSDVRSAVAELEAEVESHKDEFTAVSAELKEGLAATVEETRGDLESLGRSAEAAVAEPTAAAAHAAGSPVAGNGATPASNVASGRGLITPRELPAADDDAAGPEGAAERPTDGD